MVSDRLPGSANGRDERCADGADGDRFWGRAGAAWTATASASSSPSARIGEQVLVALAVAAGVAIRNARSYEQARRGSAWREAAKISEQSALEHAGFAREGVTRGPVA